MIKCGNTNLQPNVSTVQNEEFRKLIFLPNSSYFLVLNFFFQFDRHQRCTNLFTDGLNLKHSIKYVFFHHIDESSNENAY